MAITVKHKFVSTIPDGDDTTVVRPSNWNDTHELTGLGTMAEQDANAVAITGGTISGVTVSGYVPTTRTITAGTGLTGGGDLSANRTIALANTAVTAGTYGSDSRSITQVVDAQGRLTSIYDQPIAISYTAVSGLGTAATKDAGVANGVATLDAGGKVPASQIPLQGDLNYQGTWNATTNTPTLTSSTGTKGYYYVVDVAGTTNLDGITDWQIGDWAIFNGTVWQKVDNTDAVTSVNGFTGTVVLTTTNIAEGTNEYFTTAKARASVSAGTGISYNSTTGVITNSSPSLGGNVVGPASATDNAIARYDTTTGKLIQNSAVTISDAGDMAGAGSLLFDGTNPTAPTAGTIWFDASTNTWNAQQNAITQQIGEETLVYGKATNTISGETLLQAIVKTGTVGASGVITFGVAGAGITDAGLFIGMATEDIATNGFGRVTNFGVVHGINTTGSTYGETWVDGQDIWYNPATGGLTKTKPSAPNIKVQLGTVINAGAGGSGSFQVLIGTGSELGGTDSNVQLSSPTAAQLLTYSTTDGYWKNTSLAAGTGISVGNAASGVVTVTNSGVTSAVAGTGISVSGSTGAVTVTNTAPDQVVSITGGGTTTVTGTYPNFTVSSSDQYTGTVTSVAALTLGTTGTDLSSTVANSTTTPVITLNVPTASATNRGALSAADWSTFNGKAPAVTYTTNYVPYGQGTTTPALSANFTFNGTNLTVGTAGVSSRIQGDFSNATVTNRTAFQTGTTNSATGVYALPNGTSTAASWQATNAADPTNASKVLIATNGSTDVQLVSGINGTGTYLPLTFWNSGAEKARLSVAGGFSVGTATDAGSTNILAAGSVTGSTVRASNGIVVNSKTVSASYTIASGDSAMSVGAITVASGQTVTISSGSRWVVL
jgi:hypothetical protein